MSEWEESFPRPSLSNDEDGSTRRAGGVPEKGPGGMGGESREKAQLLGLSV